LMPSASSVAHSTIPVRAIPVKHTTLDTSPLSDEWPNTGPRQSLHPSHPHSQGPVDISANRWTNLYPQLNEISAVSSTEAWAVGEYGHLAHYIDGSWTAVDPPNM